MPGIEYPITVDNITNDSVDVIRKPLLGGETGDFVSIRPCGEEYEDKTFLGVLLGDIARTAGGHFDPETGTIHIYPSFHNPAIFVPELRQIIFGSQSWWGRISSPDDLKQITDADIDNVWYVQALQALSKEQPNSDS
ncbi:hypothetical protein [Roseibium album]|uniref:hypothetical protein n=1 Tax=Roseibium album TaxID=311410 RepID=UPI003BB10C3A